MIPPLQGPHRLDGPIIQSAVNFSEARRPEVIEAILSAITEQAPAVLADWSADVDHNRMVATILGDLEPVCDAILAAIRVGIERIDLRSHNGVHPRAGAIDVIPLVPIRGVTIAQCVEASVTLAKEAAERFDLPIYLYERSARPGKTSSLPDLRKLGFEGMVGEPLTGARAPDFGPRGPHPTAGISIVGARGPLIAFNVNLDTGDPETAVRIAASIRRDRTVKPALYGVRALGLALESRGISQVSLNVTQPGRSSLPELFEFIRFDAAESGIDVLESEVIGLFPGAALAGKSPESIQWRHCHPRQILENWLG